MRLHLRRCLWCTLTVAAVVLLMYLGTYRQISMSRPKSPLRVKHEHTRHVPRTGTCNPDLCNPVRDDMLNVHLIAHSHDDVGWLKTLDQYYTGKRSVGNDMSNYHGPECVRCVLNTTIPELLENPKRKFIFIEMAFFSRWWKEIDKKTKEAVKMLIKQRRLEFVIGGWCMSDAATTYYNDIIDQHTLGFDFIDKHFGPCAQSNVAWHVDQFGHSREHSSIFAQMGFDAIILGRIDYQDIGVREREKSLEFVWEGSPNNLGDKASLFTHISGGYYAPQGFVMDGWNEHKMDDLDLGGFMKEIEKKRSSYLTNHVMMPMGSDFGYKQAGEWFHNMDTLIERVNAMQKTGQKVNVLYSTPSCYFHHVNKALPTFPTKSDDFFPYAISNGYWTGYFTSKGGLKLHVKKAGALLQACKQLSVFAGLSGAFNKTYILKAAMGVLQHHDAITGTEKEHVVADYNKMLSEGVANCQDVIDESYQYLTSEEPNFNMHQTYCPELNISMCDVTESSHELALFAYNPLSRPVTSWIRLPVTHGSYVITGPSGKVTSQIAPLSDSTLKIPHRTSKAVKEVVFLAELPAMGVSSFHLEGVPGVGAQHMYSDHELPMVISNKHLEISFDQTGRISRIKNLRLNLDLAIRQDYGYYESKVSLRSSGAYIFSPKTPYVHELTKGNVIIKVFKGSESTEIHQQFNEYVSQVVRLYNDADYVELEWTVGPIPVEEDHRGKEIISMFKTKLETNGEFYTDSNGREMLRRKRNHRDTWKLQMLDQISGNYYPVTGKIFIRDAHRDVQLTVLTDRCQGGSSEQDGNLELMVHRRTLYDDGLGVGEPLNEIDVDGNGLILRGKHILYLGTKTSSAKFHRDKSLELHLSPTLSFFPGDQLHNQEWNTRTMALSALKSSLPQNVQILSLDYAEENNRDALLLRLEHIYEKDEHPELSRPATVDIQNIFAALDIVGIEELTLGANFNISQVKRLRWKTERGLTPAEIGPTVKLDEDIPLTVKLYPMEIRTFHIDVEEHKKEGESFFKSIFR